MLKTPKEAGKQRKKPESKNEVLLKAGWDVSNGSFQKESRKRDLAGAVQMAVCDMGLQGKSFWLTQKIWKKSPVPFPAEIALSVATKYRQ